jgi:hypothetical protein
MTPNLLYEAALSYAQQGYRVIPLKPCSKIPLTTHGFKDASADIDQIHSWWGQYPDANIGLITGKEAGFFVIDIDGEYPADWVELPPANVRTHKGVHIYCAYPAHETIKSRTKINGHPVDIRGDGAYIVAPPSVHPEGGRYEFIA